MNENSLVNELRILIHQYESVLDYECALFYSYELIQKNNSESDKHKHFQLLFQNGQFHECYSIYKEFFPDSQKQAITSSFLFYIKSCIKLNKKEAARMEMQNYIQNHPDIQIINKDNLIQLSQFYFLFGEIEEEKDKDKAIQYYQQCLQYDSNNIIANKKIIQLQSYSSTKAYISSFSQMQGNRELLSIQKKYLTYYLCKFHPFLLSYQQLLDLQNQSLSPSFLLVISNCLRKRGDFSGSYTILQQLLNQGVFSREFLIEYTIVLYQKNLGDTLYSFIHSYSFDQSTTSEVCYMNGVYSLLQKNFYAALQHFNLALTKDPCFWEAWVGIGIARSLMEEHEMAISAFSFASQQCPQDYSILYCIVNEYKKMGKMTAALRELNDCLSIDTADPCLFNECGVLCYHLKQYDKAEKALVTVLKLIDTYPVTEKQRWVSVYFNLSHVYRKQNRLKEAQMLLQQVAILGGPLTKSASYHISLGMIYHAQKNIEEACVEYELALACDPSNTQAQQLFDIAVKQFSI